MTFVGNLFLGISILLFFLIFTEVYLKDHARGGDAVMGFAWGIIFANLFFLGCMTIVAVVIGMKGGFDWIGQNTLSRYLLVIFGLFFSVLAAALTALFRGEPDAGAVFIKLFSGFAPALIPVLLIFSGAVLLNQGIRDTLPPAAYKIPLSLVFWLSCLILGAGIIGWIKASNQSAQRAIESELEFQDQNHQRMLDEIDSCDVSKNMVFILVMTDRNQTPNVREKAVEKVKTHPDWQKELIRLLECDWAPEAFNFLASNEVTDKGLFLEPVRKGVLNQARLIRESIRKSSHPSHFYPDLFSWEVDRALWTVEKFEGSGVDYLPAVKELRAALDEPTDIGKPVFRCAGTLDAWIKRRQ